MARTLGPLLLLLALACALPATPARAAGPAATSAALDRQMRHAGAGSGALAVDLDSGDQLYAVRADTPRVPASVEKLYTTSTALTLFGAEGHLSTEVLGDVGLDDGGVLDGNLYLLGGGDPTFGARQAGELADALIAATGLSAVAGRVIGDESAFDALRGPPSSGFRTSSDVGPLSALTFNRGRTGRRRPSFHASPARFAAQAFARALVRRGVMTGGQARRGLAPNGAVKLAEWSSPTMAELARQTNRPSDNFAAETLVKAVGAEFGGRGSTRAGAAVIRRTLAGFGLHPIVVDGSGLSRGNRTTPRDVVRLLNRMADSAFAPAFEDSLAVAGRNGTLDNRMRRTAAQDHCRAKTGTLSAVSALAGYCLTTGGSRVAFAFLMNGLSVAAARRLQDRMTVALARYAPAG
ncbi:MAG TPA: D-alanyl-D-alanine carboxypeptidase/D-alanyl-D-alanine-endopeptidase [Solirubrobacteraceae bacterium]|nr:D-alanyl-D-alanine carboxypeptidase/D-alanyl-D-alanine-endopeptidase [Solirubrobacteraceae bacterium]